MEPGSLTLGGQTRAEASGQKSLGHWRLTSRRGPAPPPCIPYSPRRAWPWPAGRARPGSLRAAAPRGGGCGADRAGGPGEEEGLGAGPGGWLADTYPSVHLCALGPAPAPGTTCPDQPAVPSSSRSASPPSTAIRPCVQACVPSPGVRHAAAVACEQMRECARVCVCASVHACLPVCECVWPSMQRCVCVRECDCMCVSRCAWVLLV